MANTTNDFKLLGSLSYMAEYFRQFDLQHPEWGELEHISYATKFVHPDQLMNMLHKDFLARKSGGDNVAMFVCGTQGCQPAGSKVLLSNGTTKNIENIEVGDEVVSLQYNGNTTFEKVINTTNWFCDEMYSVISKRNNELLYKCSNNHLIPVTLDVHNFEKGKTHKTRKQYFRQLNVLATPPEIMRWQKEQKTCRWQTKQGLYIEKFKDAINCEIEPYSLGIWLGNGHFSQKGELGITSNNKETMDCVNIFYPYKRIGNKTGTTCKTYSYHRGDYFCKLLEQQGLKGKKSGDKFIPKSALTSDSKYRLKLLAGLIDTDGYVTKDGQVNITTKSPQLAEDIKFLVCSLGGNSAISKIHKTCQVKDFIGTYYNVTVTLGAYKQLLDLKVEFKRDRLFNENSWQKQGIINFRVEKAESGQVYGFELTGDSKLYVTDNMVVTHNTGKSLTAYFFAELLSKIWGTKFDFRNLGFFDAETSISLENAKECETIWQDEHDSKQIGALSMYLKDRLVDFVLRGRRKHINFIFCSPTEQDKGQFITLETKSTRKDPKTGKPIVVECLVKTPWYFDANQRMTRGIIFVPVHELSDWDSYDKRKVESLEKLKSQYGSNFDFIGAKAKEIFMNLKQFLIEKNKKGEWIPKKGDGFKAICLLGKGDVRGIGSSGTKESRDLMLASVKDYVVEYCSDLNGKKEEETNEDEEVEIVTSGE
jgi:hypothetical protein